MAFLRNKYFWIVVLVVIASLASIRLTPDDRQDLTVAEKMVRGIYAPLERGVDLFRGKFSALGVYFADKQELSARVEQLEKDQQTFRLENQAYKEYRDEAQRLKELLDFTDQNLANMSLIPSQVIARSPNAWYRTLVINRGYRQGVERDMAVITPRGLVGRITTVAKDTSVVLLITDREGAVGALVQENRVPGIVNGNAQSRVLEMRQIPYYGEIKKGDTVITSRFSGYFPQGIVIGTVEAVTSDPEALKKTATIKPAVDLDNVEEVLIIKDYTNPAPGWGTEEVSDPPAAGAEDEAGSSAEESPID